MKTQRAEQVALMPFDKETIHLWRNDKTKGYGLGAVSYGNVDRRYGVGRVLMEDKGYVSKCTDPFNWFPVSGDKNIPLFLAQGGHHFNGKFYGLFLGIKG